MVRVVIVDFSMAMGLIVKGMIDGMGIGWTCDISSEAEEALQKMRDNVTDLAMVDIAMPGADVDGFVIAQTMRNAPDLNHIPIILMGLEDQYMETTLEVRNRFWRKERDVTRLYQTLKAIFPQEPIPIPPR